MGHVGALLLGACAILPGAMTATTVGFEVLEFSHQTQFPGVESNLYATVVHRVKLNGNFTEGVQRFELWVDSVALPVRLVQDRSGIGMDMGAGRREGKHKRQATRHTPTWPTGRAGHAWA